MRSCCNTARAAWTAARLMTTALKLSRKAAASRYSRRASLSNSRTRATRRASTRRARRRATPRSLGLGIRDDSERRIEIHGIVILRLYLEVAHLYVIGRLLECHQQRQELRELNPVEPKIDGGLLVSLQYRRLLRLHADDSIADLDGGGCFFHACQQGEGRIGRRQSLFQLRETCLLRSILASQQRQFTPILRFSHRLSFEPVNPREEGIDHDKKEKTGKHDNHADHHDGAFASRQMPPTFLKHRHHGRCTV